MSELHNDSITERPSFRLPKETQDNLAAVSHALTDSFNHRPFNWNQDTSKADASLPGLAIVDSSSRSVSNQNDVTEARRIERMVTTGDASGLQQELHNHTSQELREPLRIAQEDLARSGINLVTDWKFSQPVVHIDAATDGHRTSVEFNDPLSVRNVPLVGSRYGGVRDYSQNASNTVEDARIGLNRVLNEALVANWHKQDAQLAREGHADWHIK